MTIGKLIRAGILAAAAVAGAVWIIGSFASRKNRSIVMTIMVPADAELGEGTAIVSGRKGVGAISRVLEPTWGLALEVRSGAQHPAWVPVVLSPADSVSADSGAARLRLFLDRSDSLLALVSAAGDTLLLRRDELGVWSGRVSPGFRRVVVNQDSVPPGGMVRAQAGDVLAVGSVEMRFGATGQFRQVRLRFTTRKLCPEHRWTAFFPNSAERERCRARMLGGASRLQFGGTLGLTKPILKLTPSYGNAGSVEQPDRTRLPVAIRRDLQDELGQILGYLNSPRSAGSSPNTQFEYTLTQVNSTLETIDSAAHGFTETIHTLHAGMKSREGAGRMVLGEKMFASLQSTLDHVDSIIAPIAETTGTLVRRVGLGPIAEHAETTLVRVDRALQDVQGQVDRLAPRFELAVEGAARTIEGAEGTLVAAKAAAEDIQSIKRGAQGAKKYAVGGGIAWLVTQLALGVAALVYIIPP